MDHKRKELLRQLVKFNYIGVLTVIIGTLVYIAMIYVGVRYYIALFGDYLVGIVFSYYMHKNFTFRVKVQRNLVPILKTTLMYLLSYGMNVGLLKIAHDYYGFGLILSQLVILILLSLFNFIFYKLIIFW